MFGLISPRDLLGKLGRDLEALRRSPSDCDLAFNVFVIAEHMLDLLHPDGAKHFEQLSPHHRSVGAYVLRSWRLGVWRTGVWGAGTWSDGLSIVLAGDAAVGGIFCGLIPAFGHRG